MNYMGAYGTFRPRIYRWAGLVVASASIVGWLSVYWLLDAMLLTFVVAY